MKKTIIKPSLCISIIAIFAIMVCAEASFALRPRALSERSPDKAQEELIEPISEQDASNKVLKAKSLRGELEDYSGNPDLAVFFNETDSRHYAVEQVAQRRRNDNGKIRILSVGCGDGKGAYSIAIALLKLGIPKERIEVIGVDIIGPAIDVASYGVYSDHDIRKTVNNRSMEGNPFIRHDRKQGAFIISDEARQCVRFKLSNADSRDRLNEIGRQFDLIDCNNVLEWLAPFPVQFSNVLDNFIFSLNDTGLLFLGFFQKQPNMQRVREYVDANQDRIHVIRFPNRPDGQSYSSLDSSILIARSITRGKEARAIMSCVMRATAFDERKDPGAKPAEAVNFLSVAFPFFNMPVSPMHAMIFETAKTRIIHEICLPSEDDPSARIPDNLIDWGGASSVLHARGLYDCYDLQNKCVIHVIDEVKGKKVGELFGFPLSGENDDFENLLPVVSYTSNKDNKLHIFITKRFEQDYLHFFDTEQKRFHLFGSHSAENLKHMRLAEMIEQARFENSAETQTLSPAQKALLSTFKSSVFLPTGRDAISSWHKWVIDMLSLTETGRRYLYSALDAKAPPLENASWQAYLGHLYEYSEAVLKECKAAGYHTRREARHIFRSYHHGDIRAFEEQCRDLGIDPVLLNERIEDIERAHVKNLMRDFKPDRLIFGEATSETDVAIQDSNPIVEKTPKPGKEQEVLESYLKAQERLGGLITDFVIINGKIYAEKVTAVDDYLMRLIDNPAINPHRKRKMGADILKKCLACLREVAHRGVIITDCKLANFGVRENGEVVLLDLGPRTFTKESLQKSLAAMSFTLSIGVDAALAVGVGHDTATGKIKYRFQDPGFANAMGKTWARDWVALTSDRQVPEEGLAKWEWKTDGLRFMRHLFAGFPETAEESRAKWRRITFIPNRFAEEEILRLIMETVHMAREQTPLAAKSDDAGSQRSAAGLMSSILRPRAANERETPAAFLKFPSPRYHIPDVEKKIRNIIDTVCKPQGSRKASLRTVDWNAVNAVMRQKRLKEFTGSEKYILHAVSIKDAAGKELLGFPMIEGSSSLLDLLPSVSYEKDGQLHIFITKGFYDDYFKISHMGRSIGQKRLQSLRLAELIDHETFEHSSAGMGLPPDERHHAAATRARYFIPPGGTISCYHRWTIDALAHNKEGRKGLEVLLDEYEFRVQEDNVQATYEKAFYEKAKRALLGRKKFSSETQIDAIHILRTYQYGDMPAFRELCKAARVDPAGLNDVIEAEEARHVRNEIDGFHPDPALTVEDTTEMNTEKDPLKRRVKKTPKRPEEKEEIFASYRKAQERLGGLIANFVIVDDAVYQEEVTPVLEYLIHLGNGTGPFEDLSGNSPEEKKASSEKKAKIGIDILNKWLECIIEAAKRGVVIGDCKLENFGVTKDGEVVLFDLAPKTFTEKEDMSDSEWCAWAAVQIKEGINEGACQLAVLGEREEIRGTYIPPDPNMKILKELRAKKWLKFLEEKMSGRYIKARYEPVPSVAIFEWPEEDPEFINDFKSTVTQSEGKAKAEWRRITFIPNEIAKEEILQLIMQNIQAPAAGKAKRATRPRRPVAKLMSSVLRPQAFAERAMRQGKDGREEFLEGWYEDKLFVFDNRVKKVRPLRIVRGDKITDPTEIAIIRRGIDEWLDTNEIKYYMVLMMAKANPAFADWYYVLSDDGSLEAFAFLADNWMGTVLEIAPWNRREKGNARRFVGLGPQFFTYCMKIMTDSSEEAGILLIHPKLQKMLDNTSAGLNRLEHRTRKHTEALMKWQRSIIERLIDQYGFAGSNRLSGDVTLPRQLYQLRNPFETDMNEGQEQWIEVRNYVSDEPTKGMFRVYVNPTREEIDKAVEIAKQVLARSDAPAAAFKYLTPDSITRGYPGNTKIVFYLATPQDVLQLVKILRSHPSYHNLAPAKALMDTIPVDSITMISGGTREDLAKRKPEAISRTAVLVEVFKAEGVSLHDGQSSFGWVIPADGAKLQSLFFVAAEQRPVKPDRNAQAYI